MLQSKSFIKTLRAAPKDAITISHKLLVKGGYINELTSGVWSLLPLGFRVYRKIENIVRQRIDSLGAEELRLPSLIPRNIWEKIGRWETIDPPLFKLKDRHNRWYGLGSTHEEVITQLVKQYIVSYRDLPKAIYQIQNKFRNEMRATGGLLRTREFMMKDLYSFHISKEDLSGFYKKVMEIYYKIYKDCGIKAIAVKASSGSIGGYYSHEFMALSSSGEDKISVCPSCGWATHSLAKKNICPECGAKLIKKNAIEIGHIFKLGTTYSKKMKVYFIDKQGRQKPIIMGCYGIGIQRLMATIVEIHNDKNGIIWPSSVAPYNIHLIGLDLNNKKVMKFAKKVYKDITKNGQDILFDDRQESPGIKFKDADLIGAPIRLIVSKKTGNKIEYKKRSKTKYQMFALKELLHKL